MRNKLLMYLFIFTLVFAIFIYINDKKILDTKEENLQNLEARIATLEAEKDSLLIRNSDLEYFSLSENEEAISYFENQGMEAVTIIDQIKDEIISKNKSEAGNELVPYEGMEGVMRINKIKVLNHRWIIADFTDGTYWGEIFINYYVEENGDIEYITQSSFLYPKN